MAICLRRILRNYSPFSYSGLRIQQTLLDQKNSSSSSATAIEVTQTDRLFSVNQCYSISKVPAENVSYRLKFGNSFPGVNEKIKNEDTWRNELTFLGNDLYCDKLYLSSMFEKDVCCCAKEYKAYKEKETQKENVGSHLDRPDNSQLQRIQSKLSEDLPRIFEKTLDHNIYHENMVFENNIRGTVTIGIRNYLKQIAFLRVYVSLILSSVKFDILKITVHEGDGTVRVRWRIRGVPGFKVMVLFWKQKVWRQRENIEHEDGWFDGFSIFYVKSDGLIHKHVATKLMPDDSRSALSVNNPLAAKLALMEGLASYHLVSTLLTEEDYLKISHSVNKFQS